MPDDAPSLPPVARDARTRVLDAAEAIVQARGVPALTLEGAAREAGVSKGGLLYHFASKEALLSALMDRLAEGVSADFDALVAAQPEGAGRVGRATLAWAFDTPGLCAQHERAAAVMLAAFHHDPAMLDPVRAVIGRMRAAALDDGVPTGAAMAVLSATDGLFMARLFRLYQPAAEELAALHATLAALLPRVPGSAR